MTIDIDAIRKREQAATPGPWRAHTTYPHTVWQGSDDDPYIISTTLAREVVADAEFIAHARQDIPALLAQLDKTTDLKERYARTAADLVYKRNDLEAELEKVHAQVADLTNRLHHAEQDNASHTRAGTAWANEVAALKRERDELVAYNRAVKGANDDLRAELARKAEVAR